jgi:hypothetical protein
MKRIGPEYYKRPRSINYLVLIDMLGDRKAPYDEDDVMNKLDTILDIVANNETFLEEEKLEIMHRVFEDLNTKVEVLLKLKDNEIVSCALIQGQI